MLALYFVDTDSWAIWIGDDYLTPFTGKSGDDLKAMFHGGGLHRAKQAFLAACAADAAKATSDYAQTLPAGTAVLPEQKIKIKVDAVIDALIFKLESTPKS